MNEETKIEEIKKAVTVVLDIASYNYNSVKEFEKEEPTLFWLVNEIQNILNN